MPCFCVDGFLMRFAAAHFGQRNAGSLLNAFMRTVLCFLASRDACLPWRAAFTRLPTDSAKPGPVPAATAAAPLCYHGHTLCFIT